MSLYYKQYQQTTLKIAIQLLSCVILFDIIWVIIMSFAWKHNSDDSDYWRSLSWMHGMVYFLSFFEMIAKGIAIFFLVNEYKLKNNLSDLAKTNYFDESKRTEHKTSNNTA